MAQTKILATLGPASEDKLEALFAVGLDGFRINMSHVRDYDKTSQLIDRIRENVPRAFIAADLEGPKIRLGTFDKPVLVEKGQIVKIAPQSDCPSDCVPIQVEHVYKHVSPGNLLLINDGAVGLKVSDIKDKIIYTNVMFGTQLDARKGVNIPEAYVPMKFLSDKDAANLDFLLRKKVDYVSASFTQNAGNLMELKDYIRTHTDNSFFHNSYSSGLKIIAKIENPEGLKNFDDILKVTDMVMVARGDLGMELGPVLVPENQKKMIAKCNYVGKPVITATQMLEGMIGSMEPKRSEISDIFNAVLDGTDIVMLSGETSMGQFPKEAVDIMNQTLDRAEIYFKENNYAKNIATRILANPTNMQGYLLKHVLNIIEDYPATKALIAPTNDGYMAQQLSKLRTDMPIIALTPNLMLARQLNAVWGVNSYQADIDMTNPVEEALKYAANKELLPKDCTLDNVLVFPDAFPATSYRYV